MEMKQTIYSEKKNESIKILFFYLRDVLNAIFFFSNVESVSMPPVLAVETA